MTPAPLSQNPVYLAAQRQLDLSNAQQSVAMQNLVNQDTPGYVRQIVKGGFQATLKELIANNDLQGLSSLTPSITTDSSGIVLNENGNNVRPAQELMNIRQAEILQGVAIHALNLQLEQLQAASKLPS